MLLLTVSVLGAVGGLIFGYTLDLPKVNELEAVRPNIISYVYSDDGKVLGQFALERRILVTYDQIPEHVKQAILAAEDANFFRHTGIDFRALLRTFVRNVLFFERKGASTLTMQLAKLRFTSSEKTPERKIKDILYAMEIERSYSKEQIFTFYCNQSYWGHGIYGVAAAAEFYFGKPLHDLTVSEAALLAGILPNATSYSPILYPERAQSRRTYALRQMFQKGYIDAEELKQALDEPLNVQLEGQARSVAPYFVEWVRQHLQRKYPTEKIWQGGLKIYTTVNYDMQVAANRALREGLKQFDKRTRRWTGPVENVVEMGGKLEEYTHPDWRQLFREGQMVHGLVLESDETKAVVKMGSYTARVGPEEIEWTRQKKVDAVLKPGDVAVFTLLDIDHDARTIRAAPDRIPEAQGALIAVDNRTGAIRAMVGGFDFQYSKFNRSTQALRQPGSIFKPFTYVAAVEAGYAPEDLVLDAPVTFRDGLGRPYEPNNADGKFEGLIPMRRALALSRNVPTVRLAHALGIERVIEVAHRFGIHREFPPYLPVALGAGEITLLEITSAFTVFPNSGVRAHPHFIRRVEDINGVTLEEHRIQVEEVVPPETAGEMLAMLRTVVEAGTGTQARVLKRPLGGKTGTTNDYTDSWFVGFTPQISAGVWTGYDEKKTLGQRVYGATLALPIWIDFMQEACQDLPPEDFEVGPRPRRLEVAEQPAEPQVTRVVQRGTIVEEDIAPPE